MKNHNLAIGGLTPPIFASEIPQEGISWCKPYSRP